jgi:ABC-type methionine transport system ATPase subunit
VGIARALITGPKLAVLDEPTSTLDPTVREEILSLLRSLQSSMSVAYLFVSHDIMAVERLSHRVAAMYLGHIVEHDACFALRHLVWRSRWRSRYGAFRSHADLKPDRHDCFKRTWPCARGAERLADLQWR